MNRVRRICACGLWIESEPDEQSIEHAVQVHQRQPEHREYSVLEQLRGNYVAPQSVALLANLRRLA